MIHQAFEFGADAVVVPHCRTAEDPEFFDNMEEILSVPGLDMVNLGPSDLSLALGSPDCYNLDMPEVRVRFEKLYKAAKEYNIPLMGPVAPPTYERLKQMQENGLRMAVLRNDITNFRNTLKAIYNDVVVPGRKLPEKEVQANRR